MKLWKNGISTEKDNKKKTPFLKWSFSTHYLQLGIERQ